MPVAAYILIQTEVGKTHVATQAAAIEGITHTVTCPVVNL